MACWTAASAVFHRPPSSAASAAAAAAAHHWVRFSWQWRRRPVLITKTAAARQSREERKMAEIVARRDVAFEAPTALTAAWYRAKSTGFSQSLTRNSKKHAAVRYKVPITAVSRQWARDGHPTESKLCPHLHDVWLRRLLDLLRLKMVPVEFLQLGTHTEFQKENNSSANSWRFKFFFCLNFSILILVMYVLSKLRIGSRSFCFVLQQLHWLLVSCRISTRWCLSWHLPGYCIMMELGKRCTKIIVSAVQPMETSLSPARGWVPRPVVGPKAFCNVQRYTSS